MSMNNESKYATDSGTHPLLNRAFQRRSTCSKIKPMKIDMKQWLEMAAEEDKRARVDVTHPPLGQIIENDSYKFDENKAPSVLNLSSTQPQCKFDGDALDLSLLKKPPSSVVKNDLMSASKLHEREINIDGVVDVPAKKCLFANERSLSSEPQYHNQPIAKPQFPSADDFLKKQHHPNFENFRDTNGTHPNRVLQPVNVYETQQQHIGNTLKAPVNTFAVPNLPPKYKSGNREMFVNGQSYQILALLGKGGSSKVYLVLTKDNGLLAIKCVNLSNVDEETRMDYLNEIQHLMKMQHCRHIIKVIDHQYIASKNILLAVMERGDTDLSRLIKERTAKGEGVPPEMISFYWSEILLAVKSIHDNNIIHRDLKPANFLLVAGRLKLIDFGIASAIHNEQTSVFKDYQTGTPNYMSPEAVEDLDVGNERCVKIGKKTDVWSLGCILYSFIYGKTPFQEYGNVAKFRAITNPNHVIPFPPVAGVPEILIESCRRCLIYDKNERASIDELIQLKNQVQMTVPEVLSKIHSVLDEESYKKAADALTSNSAILK